MKIWVYSLCWNESMFLPFYLWHYSTIADKIIVYDHHSTDNSRSLLEENELVEIREYDAPGIHEPSITKIYNNCYKEARGQADWVILCDIDEILYDPDLVGALREYRDLGVTVPRTVGYTMLHDAPPVFNNRQAYQDYRFGIQDYRFDKLSILNPDVDIEYSPGRHTAKFKQEPIFSSPKIKLLHYRYWGKEWIEKRNKIAFSRLSEENKENSWGYHLFPERDTGEYYTPKWFENEMSHRVEVV